MWKSQCSLIILTLWQLIRRCFYFKPCAILKWLLYSKNIYIYLYKLVYPQMWYSFYFSETEIILTEKWEFSIRTTLTVEQQWSSNKPRIESDFLNKNICTNFFFFFFFFKWCIDKIWLGTSFLIWDLFCYLSHEHKLYIKKVKFLKGILIQ